jgi:uncharacterized oxidoreductase
MKFDHTRLQDMAQAVFESGGSDASEAKIVANHLVEANLKGHDSHGVGMIPHYVSNLHAGTVVPNKPVSVVRDDGSVLIIDAGRGYGQRAAHEVMSQAIDRTRELGVAVVGLRNAHHIGRVGAYGERSVEAGLVSIHFVNVMDHGPTVAPHGGRDARLITNPVCLAMPATANKPATVLDMATSKVALGKTRVAYHANKPLAAGTIIDDAGNPSTDASVMWREPRGSLLPMGEHKGYGLALFCELLAGALTGNGTIQPDNERKGGIVNNMFAIVVDPDRMVDRQFLNREIDALIDYVCASPPRDPGQAVMVPGDPERRHQAEREQTGISIDAAAWQDIVEAAATLDVDAEVMSPALD